MAVVKSPGPKTRSTLAEAYRLLYKDKRWRGTHGIRARRLSLEPLCRMCRKRGHITVATVVDHITEHKGDQVLFFMFSNTQSLCAPCHDSVKQSIEATGYDKAIGMDGWPTDEAHPANR